MKTVDVKDFLRGKVASSGIVNKKRAIQAAIYSQDHDLSSAVILSRENISDAFEMSHESSGRDSLYEPEFVLPLPSPLIL